MKDALLRTLVDGVPGLLEQFDPDSGRFVRPGYDEPHTGWGIRNQDDVYWLALMHRTRHSDNPYFADAEILDVIAGAGDAIRTAQRSDGQVEFTKVDGSTWGWTYMPWTM